MTVYLSCAGTIEREDYCRRGTEYIPCVGPAPEEGWEFIEADCDEGDAAWLCPECVAAMVAAARQAHGFDGDDS